MKNIITQYALPGYELGTRIAESINFLRAHEPQEGYFVGFSGGKDSIVSLELCRLAGVKHQAFYSCTRIDPPEIYQFIKQYYPSVTWLFPKMTFWEGIRKRSPPLRMARWCCTALKKDPSKHIPLTHRVMGIRAEESFSRAKRGRISAIGTQRHFNPIFHWPEWAVWEFIEAYALPFPALYDEGFERIGCIVCPFIMSENTTQLKRNKSRWPAFYRTFELVVTDWHRHYSTKRHRYTEQTAKEYLQAYYHGFK